MRGLHDEIGHWSFTTTHKIISDRFWWPKIRIDVAHFVWSCDSCQKANPQKFIISNKDREWDEHLGEIHRGYRIGPGTDGKSPFEVLFGIKPRSAVEPPQLDLFAFNTNLSREFEIAISKSARVSRIVPCAAEKWQKIRSRTKSNRTERQERTRSKNRIHEPI